MKTRSVYKKLSEVIIIMLIVMTSWAESYNIVDTDQIKFFNNVTDIEEQFEGDEFFGQDANYTLNEPQYIDNNDGTITDLITGLIWQKGYSEEKMSYEDALAGADDFDLAGYDDWRLPTIKELYSLITFDGIDPSGLEGDDTSDIIPFIDTDYFVFRYGLVEDGERIIDAQYASCTEYVGTTMNGDFTIFGVNFADGRIKGYGTVAPGPDGGDKLFEVKYVRGDTNYGQNSFLDNQDNTISDLSSGLMWSKNDSQEAMNWEDALGWVQDKNDENYLGYSDWRLPNVKELQSIVDYTRAPDITNSAAIDPIFEISEIENPAGETDYPYFWSGTTHENYTEDHNGGNASYVCFGRGLGWMENPPFSGNYELMDVHGAGCQRSDPKEGDPDDYPYGHGPQGDVIRINNYVRLVRDIETDINEESSRIDSDQLNQNFPNPVNISDSNRAVSTTISYDLTEKSDVKVEIFNTKGQLVDILVDESQVKGQYSIGWDCSNHTGEKVGSGIYFYWLVTNGAQEIKKMILLR